MLQYAVSSAPTSFEKPSPVFTESRTQLPSSAEQAASHASSLKRRVSDCIASAEATTSKETSARLDKYVAGSQSPALSALASLAANAPVAMSATKEKREDSAAPTTQSTTSMNQSQYAPAATAGGTQHGPPVCQNCGTSTTPLWRRDEAGSVLCNACGLFLKLHARPRPISLKTDVIKSRNRVKTSQTRKRDSQGVGDGMAHAQNGYAAAHPHATNAELHAHQQAHGIPPGAVHGEHPPRLPSPSSLSRSDTPGLATHNAGIAPQHIFDSVTLPSDSFASPSMPSFNLRQPSPTGSPLNGHAAGGSGSMDTPQGYEAIVAQNNQLRTRVSELEVINDLFRGRVGELESSELEARRKEQAKGEEVQKLTADLSRADARVAELEKRVAELQAAAATAATANEDHDEGPARKRSRSNDPDDVQL